MHINAVAHTIRPREIESERKEGGGRERVKRERKRNEVTLSNDAAGACICDVNSAVAGSPDRSGATPPRTLSDYFTVNSLLSRVQIRFIRASHL